LRSERVHFWVLAFLGFFIVGASKMRSNTWFERDLGSRWRGPLGPSTLRWASQHSHMFTYVKGGFAC
jgi:hypothetical protein